MKNHIIFWSVIAFLLAVACKKEGVSSDIATDGRESLLKVCVPADALSKAYFADEDAADGSLLLKDEIVWLVGIPVEEQGGVQTLRYDKAIKCSNSNGGGYSGWHEAGAEEEYERNRRQYYFFDKSPHDFFTEFDKCVFFLIGSGGPEDYGYLYYEIANAWGTTTGWHKFRDYVDFVNLPASGDDHYFFKTAVSQIQVDSRIGSENEMYRRAFSESQTFCGHTDVLTESDIVERDKYTVSFPVLHLSNALLKFKIQLQDGPSVEMMRLKITLKNEMDHSDDPAWYHILSGQTFTSFSDYVNNRYAMYSVPNVNSLYAGAVDASEYLDFDHIVLGWTEYGYSSNPQNTYTLSTTPTDRYFYACVVPQSEYIDEYSYLLFEAFDADERPVAVAKKYLPSGGFQAGTRYDFTLTMVEPSVGTSAGNAGSYGVGTL